MYEAMVLERKSKETDSNSGGNEERSREIKDRSGGGGDVDGDQTRSQLDNWGGGHIFIYSCSAQLVSFEIDCFHGLRTRIHECVPPPPQLSS